MRPHTAARFLAAFAAAALASPAIAQSVTVSLTHDDPDGVVQLGETTTWTLRVGFEGFSTDAVASGMNAAIVASDAGLVASSDLAYTGAFNGGTNGGASDTAVGISFVNFSNLIFLDPWGDVPPDRSNPLTVGTFTTTSLAPGLLDFSLTTGLGVTAFFSIEINVFQSTSFSVDDVTFDIDTLTIVPSPGSVAIFVIAIPLVLVGRRHR